MSDFLTSCACHGVRPKNLHTFRHVTRTDLLSRLLRERHLIRFLIAPTLFGKTSLVADYAESVYGFEQVHWLNGRSPCFLRDLDKGIIARAIRENSKEAGLVIIEDLPYLNDERTEFLINMTDELLRHKWEVIVTMVPACDRFSERKREGVYLRSHDFLLQDHELGNGTARPGSVRLTQMMEPIERIPGIYWSEKRSFDRVLGCIPQEDIPLQSLLLIFVILILQEGDFEDLRAFSLESDDAFRDTFLKEYSYLGMNGHREEYRCHSFSVDTIAEVFSPYLEEMVKHSAYASPQTLLMRLADLLLGRGHAERACKVIKHLCSPLHRNAWLGKRGFDLTKTASFISTLDLYLSIPAKSRVRGCDLKVLELWHLLYLGDKEKSLHCSLRLCQSAELSDDARSLAALILSRYGDRAQSVCAAPVLEVLVRDHRIFEQNPSSLALALKEEGSQTKALVSLELLLERNRASAVDFYEAYTRVFKQSPYSVIMLKWLVEDFTSGRHEEKYAETEREKFPDAITTLVGNYLRWREGFDELTLFDMQLLQLLEKSHELCLSNHLDEIFSSLLVHSHRLELELFNQRCRFGTERGLPSIKNESSQSDAFLRETLPKSRLATKDTRPVKLHVKLLGGLEVRVGDKLVDPHLFSRQKVKTLLALLVLNQGKELSRQRLSSILWPESNEVSAKRNLYSIWSLLKKALKSVSDDCPYLVRSQFSCKMDTKTVVSDVAELNQLCRKLQFDDPHVGEWSQIVNRINDLYCGDLLPTETNNEYIEQARKECRSRLVEALIIAARRMQEVGEHQIATWFARLAITHDATREDAYTLLMRAQLFLGQRTAAMESYFKCRKYLSEELGIDPSAKTQHLYHEILSGKPGFDTTSPTLL